VGLGKHYGHGFAALEITEQGAVMLLADKRITVPNSDEGLTEYFMKAQTLVEDPSKIKRYLDIVERAKLERAQTKEPKAADSN